ncbi:MAG TPA: tyrosine-type recombinase/integrase, partial [Gemmatimonadales bacterium]|nr:tyrosine-type recombinase/integrase [Gemmatimonadales bacterium]
MARAEKYYGGMKGGVFRRGRIWWICYRHAGKTVYESSKSTKRQDAVDLRESKRTQARAGILVPDARHVTFEDLLEMLKVDWTAKGNRSTPNIGHIKEHFAGWKAVAITTDAVRAYEASRLAAGAARSTVNQELAGLRHGFNLAIEAGRLASKPVIKTPTPNNARKGFVTPQQFMQVAEELPEWARGPWGFAYLTGWRCRSEVLPLTWKDNIDWRAGVIRIETSKNGKPREFPFAGYPPLAQLLQAQHQQQDGPFVFHKDGERIQYEKFNKARRSACRRAKVDAIAHDLRRTAVRNLERAGVSRSVAMTLTGHQTEAVFRRYAIVDSVAQREGVA